MAQLEYISGDHSPISLADSLVIGRSADHADVAIDDKRLSRKHCRLVKENDEFIAEDLDSSNGTKVNGVPIKRIALREGDELSFGGVKLRFTIGDGSADPSFRETIQSSRRKSADSPPSSENIEAMPHLKLLKGTLHNVLLPLDKLPLSFGRKPGNDIVLKDDKQASGSHARFESDENGDIVLQDLNSTNGTKVEGKRIDRMVLKDGLRLQIGSQVFRFEMPSVSKSEIGLTDPESNEVELESMSGDSLSSDIDEISIDDDDGIDELDLEAEASKSEEIEGEELERIESAAINKQGTGKGKTLVRVLEGVALIIVLGAVGAFAFLAKDENSGSSGTGVSDDFLPELPGGLIDQKYASFETDGRPGSEGRIHYWQSIVTAKEDAVVGAKDSGIGGAQVMRVERFAPSHSRTLWVCRDRFAVPKNGGLRASVWCKTPRESGTGFVFMDWFGSDEDSKAMQRDYRAYSSKLKDWKEIGGDFVPPAGARYARMGVGVTGREGVVLFDQAKVEKDENVRSTNTRSEGSVYHVLSSKGTVNTYTRENGKPVALLRDVHLDLLSSSGGGIPVSHHEWLTDTPSAKSEGESLTLNFNVYDPESESVRKLEWKLDGFEVSAKIARVSGTTLSALKLVCMATDELMPSRVVVLEGGQPIYYGRTIESDIASDVRFTDTYNKRKLRSEGRFSCKGQKLGLFGSQGEVDLSLIIANDSSGYDDLLMKASGASSTGEITVSQVERLNAALELVVTYPFDDEAVKAAAQVGEAVANYYRIKQIELNEIISHRVSLTSSDDLFLRAVNRTNALHHELVEGDKAWTLRLQTNTLSSLMRSHVIPRETKDLCKIIQDSIQSLRESGMSLQATGDKGDDGRFLLVAARQQRDSKAALASAIDHLSSEELVQAELKLKSVIRHYPLSYNATLAQDRLLNIADKMFEQRLARKDEGLKQIAKEIGNKGLAIVDFVLAAQLSGRDFTRLRQLPSSPVEHKLWGDKIKEVVERADDLKKEFLK